MLYTVRMANDAPRKKRGRRPARRRLTAFRLSEDLERRIRAWLDEENARMPGQDMTMSDAYRILLEAGLAAIRRGKAA